MIYLFTHTTCPSHVGTEQSSVFICVGSQRHQLEFQWPWWQGEGKVESHELTLKCFPPRSDTLIDLGWVQSHASLEGEKKVQFLYLEESRTGNLDNIPHTKVWEGACGRIPSIGEGFGDYEEFSHSLLSSEYSGPWDDHLTTENHHTFQCHVFLCVFAVTLVSRNTTIIIEG